MEKVPPIKGIDQNQSNGPVSPKSADEIMKIGKMIDELWKSGGIERYIKPGCLDQFWIWNQLPGYSIAEATPEEDK
jgi:hypothetical protein